VAERNEHYRDILASLNLGFSAVDITTQFDHLVRPQSQREPHL
jgi:hypothetical protein